LTNITGSMSRAQTNCSTSITRDALPAAAFSSSSSSRTYLSSDTS